MTTALTARNRCVELFDPKLISASRLCLLAHSRGSCLILRSLEDSSCAAAAHYRPLGDDCDSLKPVRSYDDRIIRPGASVMIEMNFGSDFEKPAIMHRCSFGKHSMIRNIAGISGPWLQ